MRTVIKFHEREIEHVGDYIEGPFEEGTWIGVNGLDPWKLSLERGLQLDPKPKHMYGFVCYCMSFY